MNRTERLAQVPEADSDLDLADSERPPTRRRSRMRRQSVGKRIELSPRDIEIFRLLDRYRYLRSTFLHAFLGGNRKRFIERLGNLFHEGYIGRPEQQWQFANARYMPAIYELDRRGEEILKEYGLRTYDSPLLTKGQRGASRQFAHQLMVGDILASIELDAREHPSLRFIGWQEILDNAPGETRMLANPFSIPVSFACSGASERVVTAVVPDAIFGLEYQVKGKTAYRFFALEADRAQMPVSRRNVIQTSYLKKLLAYRAITAQGLFKEQLGVPNLLVLTVTSNERHMRNIMAALARSTTENTNQPFLFRASPAFAGFGQPPLPGSELLEVPWQRVGAPPFRICEA